MIEAICSPPRLPAGSFQSAVVAPLAPQGRMQMVGPFAMIVHALPITLAAGTLPVDDVRPHPHIGIATLSYLFEGAMTHRDTLGTTQEIEPGAVGWMVAGSGIVHSERYERLRRAGGSMHGIQAWLALPETEEGTTPSFRYVPSERLPAFEANGASGRLLAGTADGLTAPTGLSSPCYLQHVSLAAGGRFAPPAGHEERALYVMSGGVAFDDQPIEAGRTVLFAAGERPGLQALVSTQLLSFGGTRLGRRYMWWNFVNSSKDRIERAKSDWRHGVFGLPDGDDRDFTPLPADNARPLVELNG